ncbi:MAG: ubiquinol-cytochrome c reductase iron-sulfur subunit [Alphaproteobacteria bacterium]
MAEPAGAHGAETEGGDHGDDATRRDFLYLTVGAFSVVGGAVAIWPFINSMNPAADVLAAGAPVDVDLAPLEEGQAITVVWRGEPMFVRYRTAAEIEAAREVPMDDLIDPETDAARVKDGHDQYLVVKGVCTHLGCVPLGQKSGDERGDFGGWYCPCHGSHYDTSGRIRKGPAPTNLPVPPYMFADEQTVVIGEEAAA